MQTAAANVPYSDVVEDLVKSGRPGARRFYISDRKLQQLVKLLQAHALVQGDSQVYRILSTYCQIVCGRTPGTAED